MIKKKICIVTTARSEYGLLRPIMDEILRDNDMHLQLVVGGAHLSMAQGYTVNLIRKEGYKIDEYLDYLNYDDSACGLIKSIGLCMTQCAEVFTNLKPDLIIVLGDRYELIPITSAALLLHIPIAHISGGDVTLGAIDNQIRNMITMIADLHFPGCEASAENIRRMRGDRQHIYVVGEPGLQNLVGCELMTRDAIAKSLHLNKGKRWILATLHPETCVPLEQSTIMARKMMAALVKLDSEIIVTYANADEGGNILNHYYEQCDKKYANVHVWKTLGQLRYNSIMKEAWCVIGNSSSGIIEAPFLGVPVVNIGKRQKGRYMSPCVINVPEYNNGQITKALNQVDMVERKSDCYFGDGKVANKVVEEIKKFLSK